MKVYLAASPEAGFRPVPGPGDLSGRSGVVRVLREPGDAEREVSAWVIALGTFAARGGEIRSIGTP